MGIILNICIPNTNAFVYSHWMHPRCGHLNKSILNPDHFNNKKKTFLVKEYYLFCNPFAMGIPTRVSKCWY